jgi:hypothetical protein
MKAPSQQEASVTRTNAALLVTLLAAIMQEAIVCNERMDEKSADSALVQCIVDSRLVHPNLEVAFDPFERSSMALA